MLESQNELRRLAAKRLTALANQPNEGKRPETASIANIFRRPNRKKATRLEVTGRAATFTAFSGDPYANDVFRAGVDAIARLAAKFLLVPTATFSDGSRAATDDRLANLLQVEPNPYMSAYDMLYQLYTHLYIKNNAYVYVHREGGQVVGFYPLHVAGCDYQQDELGNVYCVFTFANGRTHTLPYGDVIHLRRHFNSGDVAGDPNDAIAAGVELADTQNKGIEQAIKTSGNIRGILRSTQVLGPSKLRELKDDFVKNYLSLENSGGVAAVDRDVFSLSISRVRKSCLDAALRRQERVVRGGREDGDAKLVVRRTAMHRKECERADDGERDEHGDEVEARDAHEESPCQVGRKLV